MAINHIAVPEALYRMAFCMYRSIIDLCLEKATRVRKYLSAHPIVVTQIFSGCRHDA